VVSGVWTLAQKMTSFRFPESFCALGLELRLELGLGLGLGLALELGLGLRLESAEKKFKYVFGQTSIRISELDP